ncbi:hypothetical protein [Clostridium sardiniense]|uniref:hypothetical protein n=1 Tax=Clostridium sardiniense TaxID=29369 RepID=UPI003D325498
MIKIREYKIVKNFAWLLIPATLGFYQSKLNSIQSLLKYVDCNNIDGLIATTILPNIMILKVIGYIIFFIAIVLYFKFVRGSSRAEVKRNK